MSAWEEEDNRPPKDDVWRLSNHTCLHATGFSLHSNLNYGPLYKFQGQLIWVLAWTFAGFLFKISFWQPIGGHVRSLHLIVFKLYGNITRFMHNRVYKMHPMNLPRARLTKWTLFEVWWMVVNLLLLVHIYMLIWEKEIWISNVGN